MMAKIVKRGVCENCKLIVNGNLNGIHPVANKYFPQDINACPNCSHALRVVE
jgi:RNA polymerase subunit RPABC4/transcription elongation factor Spt4